MVLTVKQQPNGDGSFDWRSAIYDALIMSGFTFFSTLGGVSIAGVNFSESILGALIASGAQFCLVLATKRGLHSQPS